MEPHGTRSDFICLPPRCPRLKTTLFHMHVNPLCPYFCALLSEARMVCLPMKGERTMNWKKDWIDRFFDFVFKDVAHALGSVLLIILLGLAMGTSSCGTPDPAQKVIKNDRGQTTVLIEGLGARNHFREWLEKNTDKKIVAMICEPHNSFVAITYEEPLAKEPVKCKECGRPMPCEKEEQK